MSDVRDDLGDLDSLLNTCILCKQSHFNLDRPFCQHCFTLPNYPFEAPPGQIFLCSMCGKQSRRLFESAVSASFGWDESCMFNAVLIFENTREPVPGFERKPIPGRSFR